jgi:hypothetical protein
MSFQSWKESLVVATADGPTLTAAAAASCLHTSAVITLPNNYFYIGRQLRFFLAGRISCVVTTPGTARFDVRMGGAVVFDTGALNLNVVAKTNVPFWLEMVLTCRAIGNASLTTFMGIALFQSEAVVGSPANTAGGNGCLLAPVGAPAVGTGVNNQSALSLDCFFTQTVATGSLTVHQYEAAAIN